MRADTPQPGFYKLRLVRNGPFVGAVIFLPCPMVPVDPMIDPAEWCQPLDRSRFIQALVDGKPWDPNKVWIFGRIITESEYRYLIDSATWDRTYQPDSPAATPRKAVDLAAMQPIF